MIRKIVIAFLFQMIFCSIYAQKSKTVFDKYITSFDMPKASIYVYGFPDVTIDINDFIIRNWNGQPYAYLYFDQKDTNTALIYGFNGKHLGWYFEGSFYSNSGKLIGNLFSKWRKMHSDRITPSITIRHLTPKKLDKEAPKVRPIFSTTWMSEDDQQLSKYLALGVL
jgi:hypothetical protein